MPRADAVRGASQADGWRAVAEALDLVHTADDALGAKRWHTASLNAIHAGIAAADAALAVMAGCRSASKDHGAVVGLLAEHVPGFGAAQSRQLTGLLKRKNAVDYEHRVVAETDARVTVDQAKRFVEWAADIVRSRGA